MSLDATSRTGSPAALTSREQLTQQARGVPIVPREHQRHDANVGTQHLEKGKLNLDGMLGAMRVVVHLHEPFRDLAQRLGGVGIHRDVAQRCVERTFLPQRHAAFRFADARVIRSEDDDETWNRNASKCSCSGWSGVDIASMRRDDCDGRMGRWADGLYTEITAAVC